MPCLCVCMCMHCLCWRVSERKIFWLCYGPLTLNLVPVVNCVCVCDGFVKGHPSVIKSSKHGRCFTTKSPLSHLLLRNDAFDVVHASFFPFLHDVCQQKGTQDYSLHSSNQDRTARRYTVFSSGAPETTFSPDCGEFGCLVVVIQGDWTCVEIVFVTHAWAFVSS